MEDELKTCSRSLPYIMALEGTEEEPPNNRFHVLQCPCCESMPIMSPSLCVLAQCPSLFCGRYPGGIPWHAEEYREVAFSYVADAVGFGTFIV